MLLRSRIAPEGQAFISVKTRNGPIPCGKGLLTDALVQQSLDPQVLEISFLRKAGTPPAELEVDVVAVLRRDGRFRLDIVPGRRPLPPAGHDCVEKALAASGLRTITLHGEDIMREPRFSSARAVWSHRRYRVAPGMRIRLLAALAEEGPASIDSLCRAVPGPDDPFACILSMACSDELEIDLLAGPLGPATIVRQRS